MIAAGTIFAVTGSLLADPGGVGDGSDPGHGALAWIPALTLVLLPISMLVLWRSRSWRPPDLPTPWRLSAGPSLVIFGLSILGGAVAASLAAGLLARQPIDSVTLRTAVLTWSGLIGGLIATLPGLLIARAEEPPGTNPLGAGRSGPASDAPAPWPLGRALAFGALGLAVALPMVEAAALLGQVLQQFLSGREPGLLAHDTLNLLMTSGPDAGWWLVVAAAVLGAPLLEEILYRGFLQQAMRRLGVGPWIATMATSAFFTLMHLPAIPDESRFSAISGLFVLSIALGIVRERTGRISPCVLAHALFNGFNLLLANAATG